MLLAAVANAAVPTLVARPEGGVDVLGDGVHERRDADGNVTLVESWNRDSPAKNAPGVAVDIPMRGGRVVVDQSDLRVLDESGAERCRRHGARLFYNVSVAADGDRIAWSLGRDVLLLDARDCRPIANGRLAFDGAGLAVAGDRLWAADGKGNAELYSLPTLTPLWQRDDAVRWETNDLDSPHPRFRLNGAWVDPVTGAVDRSPAPEPRRADVEFRRVEGGTLPIGPDGRPVGVVLPEQARVVALSEDLRFAVTINGDHLVGWSTATGEGLFDYTNDALLKVSGTNVRIGKHSFSVNVGTNVLFFDRAGERGWVVKPQKTGRTTGLQVEAPGVSCVVTPTGSTGCPGDWGAPLAVSAPARGVAEPSLPKPVDATPALDAAAKAWAEKNLAPRPPRPGPVPHAPVGTDGAPCRDDLPVHLEFGKTTPSRIPFPMQANRPTLLVTDEPSDLWLRVDPSVDVLLAGTDEKLATTLGAYVWEPRAVKQAGGKPLFFLAATPTLALDALGLVRGEGLLVGPGCRLWARGRNEDVLRVAQWVGLDQVDRALPTEMPAVQWTRPAPWPELLPVGNGRVLAWGPREVVMLDADGKERWRREAEGKDRISGMVGEGEVWVTGDNRALRLDPKDGSIQAEIRGVRRVIARTRDMLVVATGPDDLAVIDPRTGVARWYMTGNGNRARVDGDALVIPWAIGSDVPGGGAIPLMQSGRSLLSNRPTLECRRALADGALLGCDAPASTFSLFLGKAALSIEDGTLVSRTGDHEDWRIRAAFDLAPFDAHHAQVQLGNHEGPWAIVDEGGNIVAWVPGQRPAVTEGGYAWTPEPEGILAWRVPWGR